MSEGMLDGRVDSYARHIIAGWAADMNRPDHSVDIVVIVDGHSRGVAHANLPRADLAALGTLADGAHGFTFAFDPPLSPLRSYEIDVCHAGTDKGLRLGQFTLPAESNASRDPIRPLLVSTSGQPGFSALMRCLAAHPQIMAADSHEYGVKLITYYACAAEVLMTPSGRAPSGHTMSMDDAAIVLPANPFHAPDHEALFPDPRQLYDFFQKRAAGPISAAFKTVLTDFYATLAQHQDRRTISYFAEQADLFDITSAFARLAFSDIREIVLLQDPRDAYCGYRALWSVSPAQALDMLRRVRDRTVQLHAEARTDTFFLRTEDLRLRPAETLTEISDFLGLLPAIVPDAETANAATDAAALGIGQWKTELDSDEIALFDREFDTYLQAFGYDPAPNTET